ncbi:class I SAM-dependent methyltransferase [Rhizobium sp. CNPSo 4062]|uniref:class I SAM-dependent methyltransferase n=1 Tax=Rhizobium sp. CNPSo 4062 TaxID=3021410 RepID=UPI00255158B5|nr:class I SAM-dependent methyltransferase [Rhizobium sp. CNPSo 4062]MDK4704338.1 class I SAM-dependent methyltransferase [Rhizobium sp. CNPSo 4062]
MSENFDQAGYWIKRHEDLKNDPRSVGTLAASREKNEEGERELKIVVSQIAKSLAHSGAKSVLDLGCGYGRVTSCFLDSGFEYTGVDISPVAIEAAEKAHPSARFIKGNLSELDLQEKFDVVTVLYVFVHFVDDTLWRSFLSAAIARLKPGGTLVFADIFPGERTTTGQHVVSRPFADYIRSFKEEGIVIDERLREVVKSSGISCSNHFYFAHPDPQAKVASYEDTTQANIEMHRQAVEAKRSGDPLFIGEEEFCIEAIRLLDALSGKSDPEKISDLIHLVRMMIVRRAAHEGVDLPSDLADSGS